MYTRPFPGLALATTVFIGSTAGGAALAATNALRGQVTVQPLTDAFRIGPLGSMTASSGLFVPSGVIQAIPAHNGALFALPNAGATAAIAIWETTMSG